MSVTKFVFLIGAFAGSCFCQTFVGIDFEDQAAPMGCIRNAAVPPATVPAIPALKLPGVTISGGQVVTYANQFQSVNNVYYTFNGCAGVQPVITITFEGPASNVNLTIGQIWNEGESLQAQDDRGFSQTVPLQSLAVNPAGTSIFFPSTNIRKITLTLPAGTWTQGSPAGFYIDDLHFYIDTGFDFVDPVPDLMSGNGLVSDAESLATGGSLVRAVSADGVARVLLAIQATHVGEVVTVSVINDRGGSSNSTQDDGGLSSVGGSGNSRQQSIRVAALDSTQGPMAFAVYYPPPDFSRGSQDDALTTRTVQIQVDSQAPNTPAIKRSLTILRPPVVLVHDMWEGPADWDNFNPLVNDPRFFIRRASFNGVLGSRITASIPGAPSGSLANARESALGIAYNSPLLLTEIAQFINEFRSSQNAAAAQADVIVHGMGGVVGRAAVQSPNYVAPESYGLGNVNKMITIGTPHLGTPLANALLRNDNSCFAGVLANQGKFSFASATVDGKSVSGAVGDLQGNGFGGGLSPALAQIQQNGGQTAPVAVLGTLMSNANTASLNNTLGVGRFIRLACTGSPLANSLTASGWAGVFGEPSDGMVPITSQWAGNFNFPVFGMVHSDGLEQLGFTGPSELDARTNIITTVTTLLNSQARGFAFNPLP